MKAADSSHLSIGEVLALLREEFPDVTVSKIRFLESQGLVTPERTPSGYRKFHEPDVEQLRWVLRQQKEHFLPLKVIKGRLDQGDDSGEGSSAADAELILPLTSHTPSASVAGGALPAKTAKTVLDDGVDSLTRPATGASLTRAELARAAGVDEDVVADLERFGLLPAPKQLGDSVLFDEDALVITRLANKFLAHGVEARHLRMYRTMGEREAALFVQVALPYMKQRNPEARRVAQETVAELAGLGRSLRTAMLRLSLQNPLNE